MGAGFTATRARVHKDPCFVATALLEGPQDARVQRGRKGKGVSQSNENPAHPPSPPVKGNAWKEQNMHEESRNRFSGD